MSNAPSTLDAQTTTEIPDDHTSLLDLLRSATKTLTAPVKLAGFWSAVVLPFVYAPMLVGAVTANQQTFAVLLALHAVALVAGHGQRSE